MALMFGGFAGTPKAVIKNFHHFPIVNYKGFEAFHLVCRKNKNQTSKSLVLWPFFSEVLQGHDKTKTQLFHSNSQGRLGLSFGKKNEALLLQGQGRGASCQAQGHPETPEGATQDTPHQGGGIHT